MWVSPFDEMLVINEAFILNYFKIQVVADELLGMAGRSMQKSYKILLKNERIFK
jgi:hypothetical protein